MKRFWLSAAVLLLPFFGSGQDSTTSGFVEQIVTEEELPGPGEVVQATETAEAGTPEKKGLDERINEWFSPISNTWAGLVFIGVPLPAKYATSIGYEYRGEPYSKYKNFKNAALQLGSIATEDDLARYPYLDVQGASDPKYKQVVLQAEKDGVITNYVRSIQTMPLVVLLLVFGAVFFTIYFSFVNIRRFPLAINVVRGKYDELDHHEAIDPDSELVVDGDVKRTIADEGREGEVSHFQALATAVSGTVGLGNIAGVAVAIAVGGPGATFWMIVCGLLGMSSKFVECTLGVKYRDVDADGVVHGGPMYYLSRGLGGPVGKTLGVVFALFCVGASFGGGNAFQSNQATQQIITLFQLQGSSAGTVIGVILALLVGVVIIGGIKRIASVTEKIVPFMAVIYVVASIIIICFHLGYIDDAFKLILSQAFSPTAGLGGFLGVLIVGFQRAAFSNEAGAGSAAIAHSAVRTRYPASEGIVALLEPFIDTVVICTMTALVIIFFNMDNVFQYGDAVGSQVRVADTGELIGGVDLTSRAFDAVLPGFSYVLTIAIILFAFSTMISWSYYGLQSWKFLFGRSNAADISYKVIYLLFVVVGAAATLDAVITFSDAMILALVFPNMIGLFLLAPKVRKELNRYLSRIREAGGA